MNIHEYQAKEILKKFGAKIPNGIVFFSSDEIDNKIKNLKVKKLILKAQIHAGGRGKAGGIKTVNNIHELKKEAKNFIHSLSSISISSFITSSLHRFSQRLITIIIIQQILIYPLYLV